MVEMEERTVKPTVVAVVVELVAILEKVDLVVMKMMVLMEQQLSEAVEHQELTQEV